MEIGNLSDKEFKEIIIKMIKELRRRMDEQNEKLEFFKKDLENIKKNQTDMKNTISEISQKESTVDYMIQRAGSVSWKAQQ